MIWLMHQPANDLDHQSKKNPGVGFKTQPWEQCARVLYELGYRNDARIVNRMHQRFLRVKSDQRLTARAWQAALDVFVGNGYRVFYATIWLLCLIAIGTVVAGYGMETQYMVPAKSVMILDKTFDTNHADKSYPALDPILYSLDTALPAPGLHQVEYWTALDGPEGIKQSVRRTPIKKWVARQIGYSRFGIGTMIAIRLFELSMFASVLFLIRKALRPESVPDFSVANGDWKSRYTTLLNKDRGWSRFVTIGAVYITAILTALAIDTYMFDWTFALKALYPINLFFELFFGVSLPHIWFVIENLLGWALISAIVVGLTTAIFRRGD